MKNIIIILTASFVFCGNIHAKEKVETVSEKPFNFGFYAGVGASIDHGFQHSLWRVVRRDLEFELETSNALTTADWTASGISNGNINLGYITPLNPYFTFGVEFTQAFNHSEFEYISDYFESTDEVLYRLRRGIEISIPRTSTLVLSPGYQLAPGAIVAGYIGYAHGQYKIKTTSLQIPADELDGFNPTPIDSKKSLSGYQLGIGHTAMLAHHISMKLGYSHATFRGVKVQHQSDINDREEQLSTSLLVQRPVLESMNLVFNYHFGDSPASTTDKASAFAKGLGLYVGASVSRSFADMQQTETSHTRPISDIPGLPTQANTLQHDLSIRGFDGAFIIGLGLTTTKRWHFALEGLAEVTSTNGGYYFERESFVDLNDEFLLEQLFLNDLRDEMKANFGISLISAYEINAGNRVFLRTGMLLTYYKIHEVGSSIPTRDLDEQFFADHTLSRPAVQLGVGLETKIDNHLSLRTEISSTLPRSFTTPSIKAESENFEAVRRFSYQPWLSQFKMALIYRI